MADTIKRDKSGMWTEMPPSAKNRKPDVRQPDTRNPYRKTITATVKQEKRAIRKKQTKKR